MRPRVTQQLLEMLEESDHKELCCYVLLKAGCWLRRNRAGKAEVISSLMKLSGKQQSELHSLPKSRLNPSEITFFDIFKPAWESDSMLPEGTKNG